MKNENYFLTLRDGTEVWINRWLPDDETKIKAIIQFHHGMEEHSMRYVELAQFLTGNGFVFSTHDLRGHGKTAVHAIENGTGKFGKLADKDGFNIAIEDLNEVIIETKNRLTPPHLPHNDNKKIFLLGYSFGSFIAQGFIEKYGNTIDGCILCGTKGPTQFINGISTIVGKFLCLFGRDVMARKMEQVPYPMYLKRVPKPHENKLMWMATDQSIVQEYINDKWCSLGFTRSFFVDMMGGCFQIHKRKNINKIPQNLPIFFIYGEHDPVGEYGKTIKKLIAIYKKNGMQNVSVQEYKDCRHEILKDIKYKDVRADIIDWVNEVL